jgi:hypothetical protein
MGVVTRDGAEAEVYVDLVLRTGTRANERLVDGLVDELVALQPFRNLVGVRPLRQT